MMDQMIKRFPAQLREAITTGDATHIRPHGFDLHNILIAGMGGSGIGANFVAEFIRDECRLPLTICKDYETPAFLGRHTLAIASSYSGDTEETCFVFEEMVKSGAKVVVLASGGKLLDRAKEEDVDYIELPKDCPSPRACIGFSIVQQLYVLYKLNLIADQKIKQVVDASILLRLGMDDLRKEAHKVAKFLDGKRPVLYATSRMEMVALRFRQQINQNSKLLCWHNTIPEMNHNELVGWRSENENLAVLFFRSHDDHPRNQRRIEINQQIIQGYTNNILDVFARGKSAVEQSLYLLHLCDWASVYLAELKGVDPVKIRVVEYLKKEMERAS